MAKTCVNCVFLEWRTANDGEFIPTCNNDKSKMYNEIVTDKTKCLEFKSKDYEHNKRCRERKKKNRR